MHQKPTINQNPERIEKIRDILTKTLQPSILEIIDEGHLHKGHPGASTGLGHFAITISSPSFKNKNILECHRIVYEALGTLMQTDIHALKIKIIF